MVQIGILIVDYADWPAGPQSSWRVDVDHSRLRKTEGSVFSSAGRSLIWAASSEQFAQICTRRAVAVAREAADLRPAQPRVRVAQRCPTSLLYSSVSEFLLRPRLRGR